MTTVLVTGAGGPAGVSVIRSLMDGGHHVIAVDADPLAAGMYLAAEHAAVAPAVEAESFVSDLADAAKRFHVEVVVCTVGEEMLVLSGREHDLAGAALWLAPHDTIVTCLDKWRFARVTGLAGVPVPPTALGDPDGDMLTPVHEIPGPWIVKPRFGRGSRNVYHVDEPAELGWACRRTPAPIVQTRLRGREFTVDLLTDRGGRLAAAVPRWRLETRAGISTKGRTFEDERVVDVARFTLATIGLEGAANLQGFVTDDGQVMVVEVNPRFSGGLALSLAAGADLVGEYVRAALGGTLRPRRLRFRPGVTMTRLYTEIVAA
ncbi:MAG TPA: ATP-grasp domain-containing protein [Acidimicrobiia bacterium]|nr:ATP-grasp domain-containing protein [Acidimicrobiia bacterium]